MQVIPDFAAQDGACPHAVHERSRIAPDRRLTEADAERAGA